MQLLRQCAGALLDFCYPNTCALCQTPCDGASPLCTACDEKLHQIERGAACERCAMPLREWGDPCPYCMGRGISPYHTVRRLGTFQGPLRNLIHLMKYQHRWGLAEQLADRLLAQRGVRDVIELADCLAPVPLHWWRQMTRGYNQSEVIARRLAERVGRVRVVRPAVRIKRTQTQTALTSHADREANMRDAFYLWRRRSIRGRHVVVVDDVMTSAATLRALGRVLREAEPASLNALVLAVADPRGRGFESI